MNYSCNCIIVMLFHCFRGNFARPASRRVAAATSRRRLSPNSMRNSPPPAPLPPPMTRIGVSGYGVNAVLHFPPHLPGACRNAICALMQKATLAGVYCVGAHLRMRARRFVPYHRAAEFDIEGASVGKFFNSTDKVCAT